MGLLKKYNIYPSFMEKYKIWPYFDCLLIPLTLYEHRFNEDGDDKSVAISWLQGGEKEDKRREERDNSLWA